ncbi:SICAvar, type I (fragment), partial [Plasmodium knowlesi strain H]
DDINTVVKGELTQLLQHITDEEKWKEVDSYCKGDIGSTSNDTPGEISAKQKACKLFASGLKHISKIEDDTKKADVPLRKTMMCAALNLYADQLITKATDQCPLDNEKLDQAIQHAFEKYNATNNGISQCSTSNSCFECKRESTFHNCQIGSKATDTVKPKLESLLQDNDNSNPHNNKEKTLNKINKIESFCTQVQCAIKQELRRKRKLQKGELPSWGALSDEIGKELTELLKDMNSATKQSAAEQYCKDDSKWNKFGHTERRTNKAACLHFAAGLQHIYTHGKGQKDPLNAPSFEQTMGCLFLKEYSKQLQTMANDKKRGNSWVHPHCSIEDGINHAFGESNAIMNASSKCNNGTNSCFVCTLDDKNDYKDCSIGNDKVPDKVEPLFKDQSKQKQMEDTLSNTVCPILITDLLTPFLPLAPVSIGLSAMAYYLWKYFGPLGKGGPRFRRSPAEIPGPSVQEQLHDHVQQDSSHEYQLVKERKPRSAPTRTKRSGRVNRRTIIEIHFEVLDECQKGDTQLNQKDFLELLVQEFMGSELMEEEQVPKEEVLMEGVPMESIPLEQVPMERVPSLGSGFMV